MKTTVGELRFQTAHCGGDRPVVAVVSDGELRELLGDRKIIVAGFYPDTTDADGHFNATFKIRLALETK